jgi:Ca-activated chloride channel family protein
MRGAALCLLLWCVATSSAVASSTWSNLWSTPEQRAQQLLDSQQAAAAAPLFNDPRRRGYAQLRAGQYAQAAKSLAPLHDADSLYNRGNALAHTGQLRDALAAYDAALKQSPGNGDIAHNRDLVARALQKQQPQSRKGGSGGNGSHNGSGKDGQQADADKQQSGTGEQQPGAHGQQKAGSGEQQAGSGAQRGSGGEQQARAGGQQSDTHGQQQAGGGEQQGSAGTQRGTAGEQQARAGGQQPGADGQQQAGSNAAQNQAAQQVQTPSQQQPGVESKQAAAGQGTDSASSSSATADAPPGSNSTASNALMQGERSKGAKQPPPRSEQSLALDQWLRGIPDDSGELLRRKFMIEHMMKQQESAP